MTYDPALLDELARVFAEAVVRDFFEGENAAVAPTKENDSGVKDERCKDYHDSGAPSAAINIQSA